MLGRDSKGRAPRRLLAGVTALVIVVGGAGAAVAASGSGSPQEESAAVIAAAADDLGVSATELTDALEAALAARVDAAVAAGRLTAEQGAELKERIAAGEMPLVGLGPGGPRGDGPGFGPIGHFGGLEAAADYLGLTADELRTELDADSSLADVAEAEGKSVAGLVDAIVAAATEDLAAAVEAGRLTDAQRDDIVATLEERVTELVNRTGERHAHPGGPFPGGPALGSPAPGFAPEEQEEPADA